MFGKNRNIFRARALERISSPENLDQLMYVVDAKDWLPLVAFGSLMILTLTWSVIGSVPTAVTGRGILIHPRLVLVCQTPGSGRIDVLKLKAGQHVRQGDVVGHIDQFELHRRIEEDKIQLAALQAQDRAQSDLRVDQVRLQREQTLLERDFARSQEETFRKALSDAEQIEPVLKRRLDTLKQAKVEGFIAEVSPDLVQAEQAYRENLAKAADISSRLKQLDLEIKQAETREAALATENLESSTSRKNQIRDLTARINVNQLQLEKNSDIVIEHGGTILEVVATAGQIAATGARVATIQADEEEDSPLTSLSYFAVGDGKKIQPGMMVQITPDTVERQRFGGIRGRVTAVSPLPVTTEGSLATLGNAQVVEGLMSGGPYIEITAELERDPAAISGYRWSSAGGPPMQVTAGLTNTSRVTVESRAPITYVLPFLREITGIQ